MHTPTTEDEAVRQFRPLVRRMARALSHKSGGDADDLSAAGDHGVLEAVRRFDPQRGTSLQAYVARRAHGAMRDELRNNDRLSRRTRHRVTALHRTRHALGRAGGADRADVAAALGVDAVEVGWLEQLAQPTVCIDDVAPVVDDDDDACDRVVARQRSEWLKQAIAALPERLRLVLVLRSIEERPLKELATLLGVTEPRVSQLHKAAVERLRAALPQ